MGPALDENEEKGREIRLELGDDPPTDDDWASLLKEMEETPARKKPKAPSRAVPEATTGEAAGPIDRVNKALAQVAEAREALQGFVKAHPYLIAPNFHKMWEESLKEVAFTMERQRDAHEGRRGPNGQEGEGK